MREYTHGYSDREAQRLYDQSAILEHLLHHDTRFPPRSRVLEAGCGVGAQTAVLARTSPHAELVSFDISQDSLGRARQRMVREGMRAARFLGADIHRLPFEDNCFDHVFVCFVLEHLSAPVTALKEMKRVLRAKGSITAIEGDHGSCFWHPHTRESVSVWNSLVQAQTLVHHNALIGREVYPLLKQAGFNVQEVSPRWVYADAGTPDLLDAVVNRIIVPMVQTARAKSLESGLIDEHTWDKGISDLRKSGEPPHGTFFYTWFKGTAVK